jgi:type IV secretory pathway TraG/TraD family ATPase VirD4
MDYKPQFKFNLTCAFGQLLGEAKRAKVQTLVLIEEFYAVRPDDMDVIYATARKKNVVVLSCMQGLDQLTEIYPKTASSFINNSGLVAWLAADDLDSSTLVSTYCGDTEVYKYTKSRSYDPTKTGRNFRLNVTENVGQEGRKLISPQEVRYLPSNREILWVDGIDAPVLAARGPYFKTSRRRKAGKNPYAPIKSFWR